MGTILIALQAGSAASNAVKTWNSFSASAVAAELVDSAGAPTSVLFDAVMGDNAALGIASNAGSGDAAWVNQAGIVDTNWNTGVSDFAYDSVKFSGLTPNSAITSIKTFSYRGLSGRNTDIRVNGGTAQSVTANSLTQSPTFTGVTADANGEVLIEYKGTSNGYGYINAIELVADFASTDYTVRKGSTATVTHTLTAAGLTSATLNGQAVTIASQSGQTADITFSDTITTSGAYDLVLGDGVDTQTITVEYNVIGLTANTIQKEGVSIGARTDLEMDVLDGVSSTILDTLTEMTTNAAGETGAAIVAAGAVGDSVRVSGYSEAAGIGFAYKTTLGLL